MKERTEEQLDDLWEITSNLSTLIHELRERISLLESKLQAEGFLRCQYEQPKAATSSL